MPAGDVAVREGAAVQQRPSGLVRLETGAVVRIVPTCGPVGDAEVFTPSELRRLDDVIDTAEASTGLRFAAYVGDLGGDSRAAAQGIVESLGDDADYTALVAISPAQRLVEIVTGPEAALRISERGSRAAVLSVVASCADGDLLGGLTNGVRILTDHAGEVS